MKLSTHNQLPGMITELVRVDAAPKLTLRAGANHLITLITRESADEVSLEAD